MTIKTEARAYVSNTGREYMEWLGADVVASIHAHGTLATLKALGVEGISADRVIFPSAVSGLTGLRVRLADYNAAKGIEAPAKPKASTKGAQGGTVDAATLKAAMAMLASLGVMPGQGQRKGRKAA